MLSEAIWLDLVKSDRERQKHMISLICGILKNDTSELIYKQKESHNVENNLIVPGGRSEG